MAGNLGRATDPALVGQALPVVGPRQRIENRLASSDRAAPGVEDAFALVGGELVGVGSEMAAEGKDGRHAANGRPATVWRPGAGNDHP